MCSFGLMFSFDKKLLALKFWPKPESEASEALL